MAIIYAQCNQSDNAMDELEHLFTLESDITINELQFIDALDPLHNHPRYKELLKKYGATGEI